MTRTATRMLLLPAAAVAVLLFILTSCPSNRDGMPGRLAAAKEETQSAAYSAALALDLWQRGRSSRQLVSVQLSDARDEVVNGYDGIAVLRAEDPVDLARQTLLIQVMTDVIGILNRSNSSVRGLPRTGDTAALREDLLRSADTLQREYR